MTPERIAYLRYVLATTRYFYDETFDSELTEALDEIERLRALCAEAIGELVDWSAYAPDYFKEKWKLDETIASLQERLG